MATIGLDMLYYAKITENEEGDETYDTPVKLAKAISAELSVELVEAILYADDGIAEIVKEFKGGTLSLGIDDIGGTAASDLTGAALRPERCRDLVQRGRGRSCGDRFSREEDEWQIQVFLALQGEVRHSRH